MIDPKEAENKLRDEYNALSDNDDRESFLDRANCSKWYTWVPQTWDSIYPHHREKLISALNKPGE